MIKKAGRKNLGETSRPLSSRTIRVNLSVTDWARVEMIGRKNHMDENQTISHLLSTGGDLVEIANLDYRV